MARYTGALTREVHVVAGAVQRLSEMRNVEVWMSGREHVA
jgi:hypothetical protein